MARKKDMTDDQKEGQYIRAAEALREALACLEAANTRLSRLYPQDHDCRTDLRTAHDVVVELYAVVDHDYAHMFGKDEGTLQKVARHAVERPTIVEVEEVAS